jgi:hypothetical protein
MFAIKKNVILFVLNLCALCFFCPGVAGQSYNAVYQYSVPVEGRTAYLWIPPTCRYVRGIIFAAENALERNWMESVEVRKTATEENLAMVWLADGKPSSVTWELTPKAAEVLDKMYQDLAKESGYLEIAHAPLIVTGHSWNGRHAWNYPAQRPERTMAAIAIRTYPMPDSLPFSGIPMLYIVGQTTELPQYADGQPGDRDFYWPVVRRTATALRQQKPNNLIGVAFNPGGCHMDWAPDQSKFLALFIRKACRYRLPNAKPAGGKVMLKRIRESTGWLTDTAGLDSDRFAPAPYPTYKGNPSAAYWFFDEEMARVAVAFNGDRVKRTKQMTTLVQLGDALSVRTNGSVALQWLPEADGVTFRLGGGFLHQVPRGLLHADSALTHSSGSVMLYPVMGPAAQIDSCTFRLQLDRQAPRNITIMADQSGDGHYRRATQPGVIAVTSFMSKQGRLQRIIFPGIDNVTTKTKSLLLTATSDAGLPVFFYVKSGPAVVEGNRLIFTDLPLKSRFPIKITVVAWQNGRITAEPFVQCAEPVSQTFFMTR